MATYNNFKSTTIRGSFNNMDYTDGSILASANFQRDLAVGGNLSLGTEVATTDASGVITYVNTGGNIKFQINNVTYTLTPTILKNLISLYNVFSITNNWNGLNIFNSNVTFNASVIGLTKTTVGLSNVDNTSDFYKPLSTSAVNALDLKANLKLYNSFSGMCNFSNTCTFSNTCSFLGPLFNVTGAATFGDIVINATSNTTGTITINKAQPYDVTSIVFKSGINSINNYGDYGSIEYYDNVYNTNKNYFGLASGGAESSCLYIGNQNDDSQDLNIQDNIIIRPYGNLILDVGLYSYTNNTITQMNNGSVINKIIIAPNTGDVGIGTLNPSCKLEVNGNTKFDGDVLITGHILFNPITQNDINGAKIDGAKTIYLIDENNELSTGYKQTSIRHKDNDLLINNEVANGNIIFTNNYNSILTISNTGNLTVAGAINVIGDSQFGGTLTVTGISTFNNTININGIMGSNSVYSVNDISFGGNLKLNTNSIVLSQSELSYLDGATSNIQTQLTTINNSTNTNTSVISTLQTQLTTINNYRWVSNLPSTNWTACAVNQNILLTFDFNFTIEKLPRFQILFSNVIQPVIGLNNIVDMTNQSNGAVGCIININGSNSIRLRFGSSFVCNGLLSGVTFTQFTSGYFRLYVY